MGGEHIHTLPRQPTCNTLLYAPNTGTNPKLGTACAPAHTRKDDDSLIHWTQPERNAHVLDWRQRAHEFGLQPGDETDEAVVLPARQLVSEDDPEAFEDQHLDDEEDGPLRREGEGVGSR